MIPMLRTCLILILFGCAPALSQNHPSLIDRVLAGDTSLAGRPLSQPSAPATSDDGHWDRRFGMPGANAEVRAITVSGDWVYVGGEFTFVGNVYANRIARWNRRTHVWQTMGTGPANGVDGVVMAIAVKGDSIIVGGQFLQAGGITAANIAIWSQRSGEWSTVGQGGSGDVNAYVSAITVQGDGFYVGGRFSAMGTLIANNIAQWDGTRWRRLGSGVDQPVYTMLMRGNDLYIGGEFTTAGNSSAAHVTRWDGTEWHAMGSGLDGSVHSLAVMNDTLYAGGAFGASGTDNMRLIAWWDAAQTRWRALRSTLSLKYPDHVYSLAVLGDTLVVVGQFDDGSPTSDRVNFLLWADGDWHTLHSEDGITRTLGQKPRGFPPVPERTAIYVAAADGDAVYVGGTFPYSTYGLGAYPHEAPCLVAWNSAKQRWFTLGNTVNDVVTSLLLRNDGIYAGGAFTTGDGEVLSKIGRWDQKGWHPLGNGLYPVQYVDNGEVKGLAADENSLYAVGNFGRRGDQSEEVFWRDVSNTAAWDGSAWKHLPIVNFSGAGRSIAPVESVIPFRGAVYAGRNELVMRWDDTAWVTEGIPQIPAVGVYTMINDHDNYIYAGARNGLYRWDGAADSWTMIGATDDSVIAIVIDGTRLFAGGRFQTINDTRYNRIAMYDIIGGKWSPLGPGVDRFDVRRPPSVEALAVSNGLLYVGGLFSRAGDVTVSNIATWDGEMWTPLGSGTDSVVKAIVIEGNDVYLGGAFRNVGGTIPSWFFAHWNTTGIAAVPISKFEQAETAFRVEPNPADDRMVLHYSTAGECTVRIAIHDMLGREVAGVVEGRITAGTHSVNFSAAALPAGIYYCRMEAGETVVTTQIVVTH